MFLSMLVAWMIPDVPRSLREQLKKENMMLMEFLLNQDQEAHPKSHSPKRSNTCFPANIDIVVEGPVKEQEEKEIEGVEVRLDEPRRTFDRDPEVGVSDKETEEKAEKESGGKGGNEGVMAEGEEKEKELEVSEDVKKGENEEGERHAEDEKIVKKDDNVTVDLDSFMSEMALLGERGKLDIYFLLFRLVIFTLHYTCRHLSAVLICV